MTFSIAGHLFFGCRRFQCSAAIILSVEKFRKQDQEGEHVHVAGILHPHGEVAAHPQGVDPHNQSKQKLCHLNYGQILLPP